MRFASMFPCAAAAVLSLACGRPEPVEEPSSSALFFEGSPGSAGLIPRSVLFGNPERVGPQLSPDGSLIAYIAPADSVLNLWVMGADGSGARQLTFDTNRGVTDFFWAEDGEHILYMQDMAGEENTHVFRLDVADGEVTDLTPFEGVRAYVSATDEDQPGTVLVEMNRDDPMFFDVYSCDLATGGLTLVQDNPGVNEEGDLVLGYFTDEHLSVRGCAAIDQETGEITYFVRDSVEAPWCVLLRFSALDEVAPHAFSEDGRGIYLTSNLCSNTTRLYYMDLSSGDTTFIAGDSLADVAGVVFDQETGEPLAVSFNYLRRRIEILDPSIQADYDYLRSFQEGDFAVVSRDNADSTWIVVYYDVRNPATYYLYDRRIPEARLLFQAIPALEGYDLAPMEPVLITSRDGLQLPCYLTRPKRGEAPWPLVVYVHGGPWARDYYGYEPFVQLLSDRGFAVLQVNFRGSSGFGKAFLNAGNREWGGRMQDDVTDAALWAVGEGIADSSRIVILGGSYGGYAVLAGVTFTPDLYCCGVDFFGPSNLVTWRETVPPYWRPLDAMMDVRVGSLETDRELLEARSPLNSVDSIRVPMLIVQGANDPRVVKAESDQMVRALRDAGLPVEYVVYDNEGHGFAMEPNRLDFAVRVEKFLYDHVPGVECQASEVVPGSTARLE
ncbi:S9 family peptidase [Candidatus Fermentibacteria bacterium]|nr:S9 family peptidase [Candidatus Fermentibacteria bacterium]